MADGTVGQVKDRLSIVDVVSQYVKLSKAGITYKARCPFHNEKTPSCVVSPERGTYHCFGCGVGGDIFSFVQEMEGLDFKGALKQLAERAGVTLTYERADTDKDEKDQLYKVLEEATLFFQKQLVPNAGPHAYLESRGVTQETMERFRIGYAPDAWRTLATFLKGKGYSEKVLLDAGLVKKSEQGVYDAFRSRIMFPLSDASGRVVGFSGRIFTTEGKAPDDIAKYLNTGETALFKKSKLLYGFDKAKQVIRKHDFSILVEGQMDLIMVHQAGWGNAVAVSGTALTEEHVTLLKRMSENVLLALDADAAGVKAAQRSAMLALSLGMEVKVARVPSGKDPAELILREGKDAWSSVVRDSVHVITFLLTVLKETYADERAYKKQVEELVLPFVRVIQSPIDRDHFIQQVARAIDTAPEVIKETLRSGQAQEGGSLARASNSPGTVTLNVSPLGTRVKELWAFLEWQKHMKKPSLDVGVAQTLFDTSVGPLHTYIENLSEEEKQRLIFKMEDAMAKESNMHDAFVVMSATVHEMRLRDDYKAAQEALKDAEKRGDEAAMTQALELCTSLSQALAGLKKKG
jgi:DNA primase